LLRLSQFKRFAEMKINWLILLSATILGLTTAASLSSAETSPADLEPIPEISQESIL
jgi:hypothetical protein